MISRTIFCSAQAAVIRFGPYRADARYLAQAFGLRLDGIEHLLTEGRAPASWHRLARCRGSSRSRGISRCRRVMSVPRFFKNLALYCWPWVRSLTHSPDAVIHSPAEITAACPTTVTSSRWPRALDPQKRSSHSRRCGM